MENLLILAFVAWSTYSGYKYITGRNEWLDRREPASIAVKLLASMMVGWVFGALAIIKAVLSVIGFTSRM